MSKTFWWTATALLLIALNAAAASAQVPSAIEAELRKMGQGVYPGCTAKLYRPLMPASDYNTYWPPDAASPNVKAKLYSGIALSRDVSFGKDPKDLVDIFVGDKGPSSNRTVLIYVPGGAGNKIEQQAPEGNAFYDNIGRWAAENEMVGVTMQRHAGNPAGQDVATMIDWLKANVAKYKGNPDRMFIWAHSAGNGPLGGYIGRPDLYGIGVAGAIFMSGNPVNFTAAAGGGGRGAAPAGGGGGAAPGGGGGGRGGVVNQSPCQEVGGAAGALGSIRGPSSTMPDQGKDAVTARNVGIKWNGKEWQGTLPPAPQNAGGGGRGGAGGGGAGGGGGRGAGGAGTAPATAQPAFTTQDGFRSTRVAIMIAYAELDGGVVNGEFPATAKAMHDELCKLEGPKAKDGGGHCPTMFMAKDHSHMSEVFSIGSPDKTVSGAVLRFIKGVQ